MHHSRMRRLTWPTKQVLKLQPRLLCESRYSSAVARRSAAGPAQEIFQLQPWLGAIMAAAVLHAARVAGGARGCPGALGRARGFWRACWPLTPAHKAYSVTLRTRQHSNRKRASIYEG